MSRPARIAIVHDYLLQIGGAERVLEALHTLWPAAPIFTTFYDRKKLAARGFGISPETVRHLMPDWLPRRRLLAKACTFVYPYVWRSLDLSRFDLVISSSSFAAHQIAVGPDAKHVCYCHSPPHFLYGLHTELDHDRIRRVMPFLRPEYDHLRRLDQEAAARVTQFVANSEVVRGRIFRAYARQSRVIHPPVNTDAFTPARAPLDRTYFLSYGRLVPSKRVEIAIQAANIARVALVVAGTGPDAPRLRKLAGATVTFAGWQRPSDLSRLVAGARAVLFPPEEDFGIVPVEAMAAGTPVLAYRHGGALETVVEGATGEFFAPQTGAALAELLVHFDDQRYDARACRDRAALFDTAVFVTRMRRLASAVLDGTIASEAMFG